jgi:glycosyltransferase involved in cell wall biosynthesis
MVSLTLVVPVLNEEILLESFMAKTEHDLEEAGIDWELIMVNDGSTDRSLEIMERYARGRDRITVLDLQGNYGPGANLYQAYGLASKDVVAYATVDGFYDTAVLPSLLVHFEEHDVVSAYRTDLTSHPGFRKVQTMINVYLQRAMFPYQLKAVHTLQIHRRDFLQSVGLQAQTPFLCSEMLYKAIEAGFSVKEVGIPYLPRHAGKATGGNPKLISKTMLEIFTFWFRWFVLRQPMLPKGFDLTPGGVRKRSASEPRHLTKVS